MPIIFMNNKERLKKYDEKFAIIEKQMKVLIQFLGMCGYPDGWIDSIEDVYIVGGKYISRNYEQQPVTRKEFKMLLEYLKLKVEPEKKVPEKIIFAKIVTTEGSTEKEI